MYSFIHQLCTKNLKLCVTTAQLIQDDFQHCHQFGTVTQMRIEQVGRTNCDCEDFNTSMLLKVSSIFHYGKNIMEGYIRKDFFQDVLTLDLAFTLYSFIDAFESNNYGIEHNSRGHVIYSKN